MMESAVTSIEGDTGIVSDLYSIIKRPLITEKASDKKSAENQVVFEVNPKANRAEIKKAVEKDF